MAGLLYLGYANFCYIYIQFVCLVVVCFHYLTTRLVGGVSLSQMAAYNLVPFLPIIFLFQYAAISPGCQHACVSSFTKSFQSPNIFSHSFLYNVLQRYVNYSPAFSCTYANTPACKCCLYNFYMGSGLETRGNDSVLIPVESKNNDGTVVVLVGNSSIT